jgi:hypothetical protein
LRSADAVACRGLEASTFLPAATPSTRVPPPTPQIIGPVRRSEHLRRQGRPIAPRTPTNNRSHETNAKGVRIMAFVADP